MKSFVEPFRDACGLESFSRHSLMHAYTYMSKHVQSTCMPTMVEKLLRGLPELDVQCVVLMFRPALHLTPASRCRTHCGTLQRHPLFTRCRLTNKHASSMAEQRSKGHELFLLIYPQSFGAEFC